MMHREYWGHQPSGLYWVVQFVDGVPARCAGPLRASDLDPQMLDYVPYPRDGFDLQWLLTDTDRFTRVPICQICNDVVSSHAPRTNLLHGAVEHLRCRLTPARIDGGSVGALLRKETMWERCARLQTMSEALRRASAELLGSGTFAGKA